MNRLIRKKDLSREKQTEKDRERERKVEREIAKAQYVFGVEKLQEQQRRLILERSRHF